MSLTLNDLCNAKYGDFAECFAEILEDEQMCAQLQHMLSVAVHHLGATDSDRFKGDLMIPATGLVKRMLEKAYAYCGEDSEEDQICRECAGSGIGQFGDPETSRCYACNGSDDEPRHD